MAKCRQRGPTRLASRAALVVLCCFLLAIPPAAFGSPRAEPAAVPGRPSSDAPRATANADPYNVTLQANYYEYFTVIDPYTSDMQLNFEMESGYSMYVYVMDQGQFSVFQSSGFAASIYSAMGTQVTSSVSLPSEGTYYLVVWNHTSHLTTTIYVTLGTVPVDIYSFKSSLPAAIGVVDYGVEYSKNRAVPYSVVSQGVVGMAEIDSLGAYNSTAPPPIAPDGASLLLDVSLEINTTEGSFVYWLQDVAVFRTSLQTYYFSDEIFNFSAPDANLSSSDISGGGQVYPFEPPCLGCSHQNSYIDQLAPSAYELPFDFQLPIAVSQKTSSVQIMFGYGISQNGDLLSGPTVNYDTVTIKEPGEVLSSGIVVSGYKLTPVGLYYDAEFVFAGEYDGEMTTFASMNSKLSLYYEEANGVLVQPKSVWEFGSDSAESAYNLQTSYGGGEFSVGLGAAGFDENYLLPGRVIVPLALSYSVKGGSPTGQPPPVLTYINGGIARKANLSSASQVFYADNGTIWSIGSSFSNNSTVRWETEQGTLGVALAAVDLDVVYYQQYSVDFQYLGGGPGFSAPTVDYDQFGTTQTAIPGAQVWADADSGFEFSQTLNGSSLTQRWFAPEPNGIVYFPSIITLTYYHQYALTASYTVLGGGSPQAPSVASKQFGLAANVSLSASAVQSWFDSGSSWSVTNPLVGSSSTERWVTDSTTAGVLNGPANVTFVYYHQFMVTAAFSVDGGGSPNPPDLNSTSFGSKVVLVLSPSPTSAWLDAGSSYLLTDPLTGSGQAERWETQSQASGQVTSAQQIKATYYHQFLASAQYSIQGGGSPAPPTLQSTSLGSPLSETLSTSAQQVWLDAGAAWTVTNPLVGSGATERWTTSSPTSGNVSSSKALNETYVHQYYITLTGPPSGGLVSNGTGWHEAGSTLGITASASSGWKFEGWTGGGDGAYSGPENSTTFSLLSPINETASFFPGLYIYSTSGGTITYSYASTSGSIQGSGTIYVPSGTAVSLTAESNSFFSAFSSWSGAAKGASGTTQVIVSAPATVTADFGLDYVNAIAVVGILAVVAVALGFVLLRSRRARVPALPAPGQSQSAV